MAAGPGAESRMRRIDVEIMMWGVKEGEKRGLLEVRWVIFLCSDGVYRCCVVYYVIDGALDQLMDCT